MNMLSVILALRYWVSSCKHLHCRVSRVGAIGGIRFRRRVGRDDLWEGWILRAIRYGGSPRRDFAAVPTMMFSMNHFGSSILGVPCAHPGPQAQSFPALAMSKPTRSYRVVLPRRMTCH